METPWIATRKTAQGTIVHLWPDGALTWALGNYIAGSAHPRTPEQRELALRAGWLMMGDVELYDDAEVPDLVKAARWAAKRGKDAGAMRAYVHRSVTLTPTWTVLDADRDGNPRVECWRLPRLRWPGLSVWRERGEYSVWSEIGHSGTYSPTGCTFRNLHDLSAHLETIGQ